MVKIYKITQTISENKIKSKKLVLLKKKIKRENQKSVFQKDNQVCMFLLRFIVQQHCYLLKQPGHQKNCKKRRKNLHLGKILT